eukprot:s920_g5.t1
MLQKLMTFEPLYQSSFCALESIGRALLPFEACPFATASELPKLRNTGWLCSDPTCRFLGIQPAELFGARILPAPSKRCHAHRPPWRVMPLRPWLHLEVTRPRMKRKAPGDGDAKDTSSVADLFGLAENRRVLLVGEGNADLAVRNSFVFVLYCAIASTYETEEQHCERFQGSQERTEELRNAGVQVLFGVDATDLASTLPQEVRERPFDRIIFQFPQHKERNKARLNLVSGRGEDFGLMSSPIHLNRELLCTFLREAKALLAPAGEVVVSLVQGQGGTPAELGPARRPKDTWQAQEMGLEAGLLLTRERSFNSNGSLTHCYAAPGDGTAAFPTERKHDISFWISPDFTEELLLRCFTSAAAGRLNSLQPELKLLDEYCSPLDGRKARTYRRMFRVQECQNNGVCVYVRKALVQHQMHYSGEGQGREKLGEDTCEPLPFQIGASLYHNAPRQVEAL